MLKLKNLFWNIFLLNVFNFFFFFCCDLEDNGDDERAEDIVDHSEDSTGSDLLLNSDGSPDRNGALNLVKILWNITVYT